MVDGIEKVVGKFPKFVASESVQTRALNAIGIDDAKAVLDELGKVADAPVAEATSTVRAALHKVLRSAQKTKGGTVGCETDINCEDE